MAKLNPRVNRSVDRKKGSKTVWFQFVIRSHSIINNRLLYPVWTVGLCVKRTGRRSRLQRRSIDPPQQLLYFQMHLWWDCPYLHGGKFNRHTCPAWWNRVFRKTWVSLWNGPAHVPGRDNHGQHECAGACAGGTALGEMIDEWGILDTTSAEVHKH